MPLTKIRWLWLRNPLKRGTDVAESGLLLLTGALIAVLVPAAGVSAAGVVSHAAEQQSRASVPVSAVLTEDAPTVIGVDSPGGTAGRVHATVRWTAGDGTVRTGVTTVEPGLRAGDRTTARVDRHGSLLRDPITPEDAVVQSIAVGIVAASTTGLVLIGADKAGVVLLNRRRYAQWEKDWAETDDQGRHRQS